jgi:pimeloyl-ACP methyl ester carboxylesterase
VSEQLAELDSAGFAVFALRTPSGNRSTWPELTLRTAAKLKHICASAGPVLLLAESYGTCLALRIALRYPQLIKHMVLINSGTCFNQAFGGLAAFCTQSGLLSYFPKPLFSAAQVRFASKHTVAYGSITPACQAAFCLQSMCDLDLPLHAASSTRSNSSLSCRR